MGELTGTDALNRSQASAEAEAGSINSPVQECLGWIGVEAVYDDPWATPLTDCQVRIEVSGSIVADGPRTKGLSAFGKEDGQSHADVRAELGGYHQNGVKSGPAVIALVANGDPGLANEFEQQIYSQLSAFETSMRALLQPWTTEWTNQGWWSIPEAKRRGEIRGLEAWWEGEVDFWASVSDVAKETWDSLKSGASKVATWYDDLPWYEKASPFLLVGIELVKLGLELWDDATELWDRRDQLMSLLKAFSSGSVAAIEAVLESLVDLPGELGELIKALVNDSVDWVQNMIEVACETDVFRRATNTIMTVVMLMTPNFWAEGIGLVQGYLLPEVLITIALIIIGALCAAAGATALAARIAGMLSKLRKAIGLAGKAGEVLTTLFSKLDEIAKLIGNLAKALRRKINETVEGWTDSSNKLVRRALELRNKKIARELERLDGGHSLDRHGPEVSDKLLEERLKTGVAPDGKYSPAPASTRFSSYDEWLKTRDDALRAIEKREGISLKKPPGPGEPTRHSINLDHGRAIDEGFVGTGTKHKKTYSNVAPIDGVTGTKTSVQWNPGTNRWEVKQHFPDGAKWNNVTKTYEP